MSIILKILGFLLLLILLVIVFALWILIVPRHFYIEYADGEGATLKVNIGFFKLKIYPFTLFDKKEKPQQTVVQKTEEKEIPIPLEEKEQQPELKNEQQSKSKKSKPDKPVKEKTNPLKDIDVNFDLIKDVLKSFKGIMAILVKMIRFSKLSFTIPLHQEDPQDTQILYGRVTNSFYILSTYAQQILNLSYEKPIFIADFSNMYSKSKYFYCKISTSTGILVVVAIYAYKQYKFYRDNYLNKPKLIKE